MRTLALIIIALAFSLVVAALGTGMLPPPQPKHLPTLLFGALAALIAVLAHWLGCKLDDLDLSIDDDIDDCPPCTSACGQGRKCPANARSGCAKNDADLDNEAGEAFASSTRNQFERECG